MGRDRASSDERWPNHSPLHPGVNRCAGTGRRLDACARATEDWARPKRRSRMRPTLGHFCLALAVLAVFLAAPTAAAQTGGTLVIGLDQEPPTLDPHASPSAVTYQIIASVTENLTHRRQDGKLQPC